MTVTLSWSKTSTSGRLGSLSSPAGAEDDAPWDGAVVDVDGAAAESVELMCRASLILSMTAMVCEDAQMGERRV